MGGKLNVAGAKEIVAQLRGGVADPSQIRDDDLGVLYIVDLYEHQLRELFMDCPESAWEALTKFHRFECLIDYIEKQPGVAHGMCSFEVFMAAFRDNNVEEEQCTVDDVMKQALSECDIAWDDNFNYMLAFNAFSTGKQTVIDFDLVPLEKTTFQTQNLSRHVPLEVALEAYKRDNELASSWKSRRTRTIKKTKRRFKTTS